MTAKRRRPKPQAVKRYTARLIPSQVWLLIERHEDEGTDWYVVLAVYSNEIDAKTAELILEMEHGNTDGEWCVCHRLDWRVEGPFKVDGARQMGLGDLP